MGLRALRLVAIVTVFGVVTTAATAALVTVHTTQNSALGKILVSASGRTLYHYSSEPKNVVKCTGSCAAKWPPLLIAAGVKPLAAPGVTASLLGTVKRPDGKVQVTYHGMPLYLFAGDTKAGAVNGQGAGGIWHAIAPSGSVVTKSATASTGAATGSGSGSGSTGSGSGSGGSGSGTGTTDCASDPGGYGCM
jgi:predicted lipoprotein with Yx(FWY)xxD motif